MRVSPCITRTCSNGTPISSAAIWASVVSWLWPCGAWAVITSRWPSDSSLTLACSPPNIPPPMRISGGPGAASMNVAKPMPR